MNSYIVFGLGRNVDECITGRLETILPVQIGHRHYMKGRWWVCEWVGTKGGGKPGADFVIDDPEFLKEHARRKAEYNAETGGNI